MPMTLQRKLLLTGGLSLLLGAGGTCAWLQRARANGIPATNALHYAGTLAEKGVPVDGPRDITVVLWKDALSTDASNQLCITQAGSTPVAAGRFEVPLADGCTAAVSANPESWVEVQAEGVSYGRQKIGAVPYSIISSAVDGTVKSTAIMPRYAADGSLGRGDGGASIYNDATLQKALSITGNSSAGGSPKISLFDDVSVNKSLSIGAALNVATTLNAGGNASIAGDVYAHSFQPQYDSGWVSVTNTSGQVAYAHNFGHVPSHFEFYSCGGGDGYGNCTTPVLKGGYHDSTANVNPSTIVADNTNVYVEIADSWWVWNYWSPSKGWACPTPNCFAGFYRIIAWR